MGIVSNSLNITVFIYILYLYNLVYVKAVTFSMKYKSIKF